MVFSLLLTAICPPLNGIRANWKISLTVFLLPEIPLPLFQNCLLPMNLCALPPCDGCWSMRSNNSYESPLHFSTHSFPLTLLHHLVFFIVVLGSPLGFRLPLFRFSTFSLSSTFPNSHFVTSLELHFDINLD